MSINTTYCPALGCILSEDHDGLHRSHTGRVWTTATPAVAMSCRQCATERQAREQAERERSEYASEARSLRERLADAMRSLAEWQAKHTWLMDRYEDCYNAAKLDGQARHPVELWNWIEARVEAEQERDAAREALGEASSATIRACAHLVRLPTDDFDRIDREAVIDIAMRLKRETDDCRLARVIARGGEVKT